MFLNEFCLLTLFLLEVSSVKLLAVENYTSLYLVDTHNPTKYASKLIANISGGINRIDVHYRKQYIFFTEHFTNSLSRLEVMTDLTTKYTTIANITGGIGITVDWINDRIYFCSDEQGIVTRADLDGRNIQTIISLSQVKSLEGLNNTVRIKEITVEPFDKLLFIITVENDTAQGGKLIRSDLEGKSLRELNIESKSYIVWNTVDLDKKRLYVHGEVYGRKFLYSCNYDGTNMKNIIFNKIWISPFRVLNETFYMTPNFNDKSFRIDVATLNQDGILITNSQSSWVSDSTETLWVIDIRLYESESQMTREDSLMKRCINTICSYKCIILPSGGSACTCPENEELDKDLVTCRDDKGGSLILAQNDSLAKLNVKTNSIHPITSKINGSTILDFHYFKGYIFYYSRSLETIYRVNQKEEPWSLPEPVVNNVTSVQGLAVDWIHDTIYWVNQNGILESAGLDGANHKILLRIYIRINNFYNVIIDPYKECLFWLVGEDFEKGNVIRTNLQGKEIGGLVTDSTATTIAIDIHQVKLYIAVRLGEKHEGKTYISSFDYDFSNNKTFSLVGDLYVIIAMAVFGNKMFLVERKHTNEYTIYKTELTLTGNLLLKSLDSNGYVHDLKVFSPYVQMTPDYFACVQKGCTHVCLPNITCACPSRHSLQMDQATCLAIGKSYVTDISASIWQFIVTNQQAILSIVPAVVVITILTILFCLWKRYGLRVGRHTFTYRRSWLRRHKPTGEDNQLHHYD